jgi:hypothetical protein
VIVAFDLDGTLALIEHRLHLIRSKPKNWPAFFRACAHDAPNVPVVGAAHALRSAGHRIEIWSGRSDIVRPQTECWLKQHEISFSVLRMRKEGDYRDDAVVKGEWLDSLPPDQRPVLVFDDRQRVVDMWRSRGVICCQLAPGDF